MLVVDSAIDVKIMININNELSLLVAPIVLRALALLLCLLVFLGSFFCLFRLLLFFGLLLLRRRCLPCLPLSFHAKRYLLPILTSLIESARLQSITKGSKLRASVIIDLRATFHVYLSLTFRADSKAFSRCALSLTISA